MVRGAGSDHECRLTLKHPLLEKGSVGRGDFPSNLVGLVVGSSHYFDRWHNGECL